MLPPPKPRQAPQRRLAPGEVLPDYELLDHRRARRTLSELQGDDPMIVLIYRGAFCPKDHQHHKQLVALWPEIRVAYTHVVSISTDDVLAADEFRMATGAQWTFLCDPERRIMADFGIQEYTDPLHDPMVPHTLVVAPGLRIHAVYNGYWYWGRPSNDELRQQLRAVSRKARPDWNILAPGLRERWESGDRRFFFPYDSDDGCLTGNVL